ncbi:MAG: LysM peptidoglycan-binding domain-containing protein [Rhabdochlamydiaceae bacterium]|nr:LysM peptidoglycan-binding domain-containing protein [Rhabdochlamydiaceae bacterium]
MKHLSLFFICITALSCASQLNARQYKPYTDSILDELRLELSDVKHELKSALVDLNILDEKVRKQESPKTQPHLKTDSAQLTALEHRLTQLEKLLDKAVADLRFLNSNTNKALQKIQDLENELSQHDQKLDEVNKLKGTLTSISKAIGAPAQSAESSYRVKAGDSLEKIARAHKISVESLKKLNQLQSDKIIIGQELKVTQ